ncbi:hypothetical protein PSHT_12911 [Puccinia striiformis]|uniref:Uncharacterized protein n=2 Tax=Puccinia striiformis TaxID=27350 RepID=A0A2S4UTQ1_9BASI|nr:hypothetical protein PSTT_13420 [Puccinia striiformis]POW00666.1 hypothetical protein PSHT_12911 [Puccinia striiformis]
MQISSYSKFLILLSIHCGVTYALFECKDPAHPEPHIAFCARPQLPSDNTEDISPKLKARVTRIHSICRPASFSSFVCRYQAP